MRVVRVEYDTVVVHKGNEIVVGVAKGIGGHIKVMPGVAVTRGEAELQISGSI